MDKIIIKMKKEVSDKIIEICDRFNNAPGELINVLHQTQDYLGYLPAEAQELLRRDCTSRPQRSMALSLSTLSSPCNRRVNIRFLCVWVRLATCVAAKRFWNPSKKNWASCLVKRTRTASSPSPRFAASAPAVWPPWLWLTAESMAVSPPRM